MNRSERAAKTKTPLAKIVPRTPTNGVVDKVYYNNIQLVTMKTLPEPVVFDWDTGNVDKNWLKHGVSNQEAEEIFINQPLLIYEDLKHSRQEQRYYVLGRSHQNRLLFISFTLRNRKLRIISARDMNKKEEVIYEKT